MDSAARESRQSKEEEPDLEDSDEEGDEDKYADDVDMPGQKFETKQRITVRNLRIREDMAKVCGHSFGQCAGDTLQFNPLE